MHTNLYHDFQNHYSFEAVQDLVENLDEWLQADAPTSYEEYSTEGVRSILRTLQWNDLDRKGRRTMREATFATYTYERPGVRIYVSPRFASDGLTLTQTIVRVTLGHVMGETLPNTDEQTTHRYVVDDRGDIALTY